MTEQKGVKSLGAFMQQVQPEIKRMVRLGLHPFYSANRQLLMKMKGHSME